MRSLNKIIIYTLGKLNIPVSNDIIKSFKQKRKFIVNNNISQLQRVLHRKQMELPTFPKEDILTCKRNPPPSGGGNLVTSIKTA